MPVPRGVRRLLSRTESAEDLIDLELRHHLDMAIAQLVEQGHDPEEARRIALDRIGDLAAYRSACRAESGRSGIVARAAEVLGSLRVALGQSVRSLARAPGFAAAVVLSLALGIGATTTVFSFADAILLRPLPYPDPDRLVVLRHEAPGVDVLRADMSDGTYLHYRANSRAFEEIATWYENVVNLSGVDGGEPERVPVAMVSSTLFEVLGARPAVGRLPVPTLERSGVASPTAEEPAAPAGDVEVLLSYELWQRRYGGDPSIVGRTIEANRVPRRVIGVLEEGFAFPRPEIGLWYPEDPDPATARAVDMYKFGVARLAPGFDAETAARDIDRLLPSLSESYPDLTPELLLQSRLRAVVLPLEDAIVGDAGRALWLLLGGMAALLLVACVNVANLVLVRAEHRQRDVAVRNALGATRGDLVRTFGMESIVLAAAAGGLALLVARVSVEALVSLVPPDGLPRLADVGVDGRVSLFAAALSLAVGVGFALVPAAHRGGRDVTSALKETAAVVGGGRGRHRTRRLLVVAQMGLALTLLVGGALMYRSFQALRRADVGFDAAGVLTAEIAMPYSGYETYGRVESFWRTAIERLRAVPGVESAGAASGIPLRPEGPSYDLAIDVEQRPGEFYAGVTTYDVSPGYFEALRIPLLEGQPVVDGSPVESPVVLSAAAARRLFPDGSALGRRLRRTVGPGPWWTVAAVVGDVPAELVGGEPAGIVYVPMLTEPVDPRRIPRQARLVIRTSVPPATLAPEIRRVVRELDPNLPLANVRTMASIVSDAMARTTFTMLLLVVSGVTALVLGIVGVYGVTSYVVGRRTQEIGLRVALGAGAPDIERMILVDGARTISAGVAVGVVAALVVGRVLRSLLFGVSSTDAGSIGGVVLVLVATALAATWLPARRAARVHPTEALRIR
ncbi:MAG: ADOP family duplicated permease [Gemmatimonadales bacterium]